MAFNIQKQLFDLLARIRRPRYTPLHQLVLIHLSEWANRDTTVSWPSVGTIAKRSWISPNHVRRLIRDLERDGLITVKSRLSRSNVYKLNFDQMADLSHISNPNVVGGLLIREQEPTFAERQAVWDLEVQAGEGDFSDCPGQHPPLVGSLPLPAGPATSNGSALRSENGEANGESGQTYYLNQVVNQNLL